MLFTLLVSYFVAQIINPYILDFESTITLEQALYTGRTHEAPIRINYASLGPVITSRSAIVVDRHSRTVLWSDGRYKSFPIASISKLMTALVYLDTQPPLDDFFTINQEDISVGGALTLAPHDTITQKDILYSALIASDNGAARALVRASGLPKDEFIRRMNERARAIGMLHSIFSDTTGIGYANVSSAQDVVLLLDTALQHPIIADAISRVQHSATTNDGRAYRLQNTNELLSSYLDVMGGKTGFNNEAQYNLTVAVKGEQNQELLIAVLGSESKDARFQDAKVLADWALRNYEWNE